MKKRCICAFICACILFSVCVLPSSASENGAFRVAVIVDDDALEGFAASEGMLRDFVTSIEKEDAFAAFYFDAGDIVESVDLTAALIYFKVNGYRIGVYANDVHDAQKFNIFIKYVTKSASRLVACEKDMAEKFSAEGYSPLCDFDIVLESGTGKELSFEQGKDTFVLIKLYEGSVQDAEKLLECALENGLEIRAAS
ncbi:MAG: hypothetical protein E7608_05660 [Ruminococcaceae bacterium]|nr:hypothetical protein [Oscillospiraceae bacterium]MBO5006234.1 hypothetical protein [Clostridia bacterium]